MERKNNKNNGINFLESINNRIKPLKKPFEIKKLVDVTPEIEHEIIKLERIKTKYGEKITAHLKYCNVNNEHEFNVFLPDKWNILKNDELEDLIGFKIIYHGKNENGHHDIEIVE